MENVPCTCIILGVFEMKVIHRDKYKMPLTDLKVLYEYSFKWRVTPLLWGRLGTHSLPRYYVSEHQSRIIIIKYLVG